MRSEPPSVSQAGDTVAGGGPSPAEQDRRLLTLFEIAKVLVAGHDLETMLPELLASLIQTIEAADAGMLLLHDPADGRLVVQATQGYDQDTMRGFRLAPGESMSGKVFQSGRPEIYPTPEATAAAMTDMTPENREVFQRGTAGLGQPLSAIAVPLVKGRAKVGVLVLHNQHRPGGFVPEDVPFLQAVADLIAIAIEDTRLREELQAARSLSEANRLKAELLSTLAHEMRTPLTSIKGYTTALLMEEATFSPETQQEFLQIVDEECDVLQDLIHDLLESSIIEAGFLRLEPQPVRLPRLAKSVIDDIANHAPRHRFLVDFPQGFPIVDADPRRIVQVLRNLLDNAVKYSPHGGLVVVRGEVHGEEIVVSVADQGGGIAPEDLNRLFEKFFRVKSGLGRHVVGSGLGLPISRTIVESHGGHIWAESQLGQGTTFFFTLPLKGLSQEAVEQKEPSDD